MMYRLVLLQTMGTKFAFNFRAILAPDHGMCKTFLPLLSDKFPNFFPPHPPWRCFMEKLYLPNH